MTRDSFQDRTERPTKQRRLEARRRGFVARSGDLNSAGQLLAASLVMFLLGSAFLNSIVTLLQTSLTQRVRLDIESSQIIDEFHRLADWSISNVAPLLLLLVGFTILFNLVQVGFLLAPEVISPSLSRINPFHGIKRILSVSSLFTLGFGVAKLLVLVLVAVWFFTQQLPLLVSLTNANTASIAAYIGQTASKFTFLLALTYLGLALLDFSFRRWKYEQDLRMTKWEIREELKSMEGDPQIRQRRRDTRQKLIQARQSDD